MEAEIGRGGFGNVYRAQDLDLDRSVAIKILDPLYLRDQRWVARFRREARVMAHLDHPHIVPIYEIGEMEGRLYLAMRHIDGPDLTVLIKEKERLAWGETVKLVSQIASALDYAHDQNIIHRDLKPGNILISSGQALLTDFGLAQMIAGNSQSNSVSGGIAGTYNYIPPEIFKNEVATPAVDIYALGCVIYEMLAGEMLFDGRSTAAIISAHLVGVTFDQTLSDTPPGTREILQKALARDPLQRYASAGELAIDLRRAAANKLDEFTLYKTIPSSLIVGEDDETLFEASPPGTIDGFSAAGASTLTAGSGLTPGSTPNMPPAPMPVMAAHDPNLPPQSVPPAKARLPGCIWWIGAGVVLLALFFTFRREFFAWGTTAREMLNGQVSPIAEIKQNNGEYLEPTQTPSIDLSPTPLNEAIEPPTIDAAEPSTIEPTKKPTLEPAETSTIASTTAPTTAPTIEPTETPTIASTTAPTADPRLPPSNQSLGMFWTRPADQMPMVYVPAGSFLMGSTRGDRDETPVHMVTLDGFWIDRTEVTNDQFRQFVAATGFETTAEKEGTTVWNSPLGLESGLAGLEDHPVVYVSWTDANAYCSWAGAALPSEAQWEYTARGPDNPVYPWGDSFTSPNANFCDYFCPYDWKVEDIYDGFAQTSPVDSYEAGASWVGALDMAGNVWEWVNDWYDGNYYDTSPNINPPGPETGVFKVLRGGSWGYGTYHMRSPSRYFVVPIDRNADFGFRCVLPGS